MNLLIIANNTACVGFKQRIEIYLSTLVGSPQLRQKTGEENLALIKKFDVSVTEKHLAELIKKHLRNSK